MKWLSRIQRKKSDKEQPEDGTPGEASTKNNSNYLNSQSSFQNVRQNTMPRKQHSTNSRAKSEDLNNVSIKTEAPSNLAATTAPPSPTVQAAASKTPVEKFTSDDPQNDYQDFINYISQQSHLLQESGRKVSAVHTEHAENQLLEAKRQEHGEAIEQISDQVVRAARVGGRSALYPEEKLANFSRLSNITGPIEQDVVQNAPNIKITTHESLFIKVALLGDGAVGKTALRKAYLGEVFKAEYLMTIGADFALTTAIIDDIQIKFQIWDLAGQPRFGSVRNSYYTGSFGALIVFDRTRPESFNSILGWLNEIWRGSGKGPVPFIILGNKSDLVREEEASTIDLQAESLVKTFNQETIPRKGFATKYLTTSAKTNMNVKEAFDFLGRQIISWIEMQRIVKERKKREALQTSRSSVSGRIIH